MLYFIVNPVSSSGKGLKNWQEKIEPRIQARGIQYQVEFTKESGDTTNICRALSESIEGGSTIVILGGDGTLNEAINGITDFDRITLGYIPVGSGNDFARDMKISYSVESFLDKVASGAAPDELDIGEVLINGKSHKFIVSSGIGFDAAVCQKVSHAHVKKTLNKVGLGKLSYLMVAINQVLNAPKCDCTAEIDGKQLEIPRLLFAASMVHRFEGGGFNFCPKADPADGIMDLCVVNKKTPFGFFIALPFAFMGLHWIFPGIKLYRYKNAHFKTSIPLWLHTDGEVWQKVSEIEVRTYEKHLKFVGASKRRP